MPGCASQTSTPQPGWPKRIEAAYGGREALGQVRYLRFDFVVRQDGAEKARFSHLWLCRTGRYRYEADAARFAGLRFLDETTQSWQPIGLDLPDGRLIALVNVADRTGHVWIDGQAQPNELVERVLQRIDNDGFWLLLPFHLRPPAARLELAGPASMPDGSPAVRLRLTYRQGAGSTPGDIYHLFVHPESHRILRSEIELQNTDRVVRADWRGEHRADGLLLASRRILPDKALSFEKVKVLESDETRCLEDPNQPLPE